MVGEKRSKVRRFRRGGRVGCVFGSSCRCARHRCLWNRGPQGNEACKCKSRKLNEKHGPKPFGPIVDKVTSKQRGQHHGNPVGSLVPPIDLDQFLLWHQHRYSRYKRRPLDGIAHASHNVGNVDVVNGQQPRRMKQKQHKRRERRESVRRNH